MLEGTKLGSDNRLQISIAGKIHNKHNAALLSLLLSGGCMNTHFTRCVFYNCTYLMFNFQRILRRMSQIWELFWSTASQRRRARVWNRRVTSAAPSSGAWFRHGIPAQVRPPPHRVTCSLPVTDCVVQFHVGFKLLLHFSFINPRWKLELKEKYMLYILFYMLNKILYLHIQQQIRLKMCRSIGKFPPKIQFIIATRWAKSKLVCWSSPTYRRHFGA